MSIKFDPRDSVGTVDMLLKFELHVLATSSFSLLMVVALLPSALFCSSGFLMIGELMMSNQLQVGFVCHSMVPVVCKMQANPHYALRCKIGILCKV